MELGSDPLTFRRTSGTVRSVLGKPDTVRGRSARKAGDLVGPLPRYVRWRPSRPIRFSIYRLRSAAAEIRKDLVITART